MDFEKWLININPNYSSTTIDDYLYLRNLLRTYTPGRHLSDLQEKGKVSKDGIIYPDNDPFSRTITKMKCQNTNDKLNSDQFIVIKKLYKPEHPYNHSPKNPILEQRRYSLIIPCNLDWSLGNVLTMGMDPSIPVQESIKLLKKMKEVAIEYTQEKGWSNPEFFFHIHPQNSIETLHLHVLDPIYQWNDYLDNISRGIKLDDVISALELES